jgi:hypothetical protein
MVAIQACLVAMSRIDHGRQHRFVGYRLRAIEQQTKRT